MITCTCYPSYLGSINRVSVPASPIKKNTKAKRAGDMAKMIEPLPSKLKGMSSNSSTAKIKRD
jgi:hypothetical protein